MCYQRPNEMQTPKTGLVPFHGQLRTAESEMNSNEIRMTVIQSPFPGLKRLPLLFIVGLNVLLGCSSITLQVNSFKPQTLP